MVTKDPHVLQKLRPLLDRIRALCLRRGGDGIRGLSRSFRCMDDNRDLKLSPEEVATGLKNYGAAITKADQALLAKAFDKDGDGYINVTEFLILMRGSMNEKRKAIVAAAFRKFDKDGSGVIDVDDLRGTYDVSRHPDVLAGKKTENIVLTEFLDSFDSETNPDGKVTKAEFDAYYAGISAGMDSDLHFIEMVRQAWKLQLSDEEPPVAAAPKRVMNIPNPHKKPALLDNTAAGAGHPNQDRVVGYTGHVPGAHERFGVSFQKMELTTPAREKKTVVPYDYRDEENFLIRQGNKANLNSHKME